MGWRAWKTPRQGAEGRGGGLRDPSTLSCARPGVEGLGRGARGAARVLGTRSRAPRVGAERALGRWGGAVAESPGNRAPPRFPFSRLGFGVRPWALLWRGLSPAFKVRPPVREWGVRWDAQGHHSRRAPPAVSARGACVRTEFSVNKSRIFACSGGGVHTRARSRTRAAAHATQCHRAREERRKERPGRGNKYSPLPAAPTPPSTSGLPPRPLPGRPGGLGGSGPAGAAGWGSAELAALAGGRARHRRAGCARG